MQARLEARGVDTRMVWTGNVTRQPMMRGVAHRSPPEGFPNADEVMEHALLLPCNHHMTLDDAEYVCAQIEEALADG